jgi:guanylate kinase
MNRHNEIACSSQRGMTQTKLLLLLGVSGAGKTTLIRELRKLDSRFCYITPYITRPLREGEMDKVSVSLHSMYDMKTHGDFLVVNELYGVLYGTPYQPIIDALDAGRFPVLDWPIARLEVMREAFGRLIYAVYVAPPSVELLKARLAVDNRDHDGSRLRSAIEELTAFWKGDYDEKYDAYVVTHDKKIACTTTRIYSNYLDRV